jgi:hypothetical protein
MTAATKVANVGSNGECGQRLSRPRLPALQA